VLEQQAYVSGYGEPNPDGKRKEQISTAQSGIELEMTPTVSADRKYVTLAMHPRVSQLLGLTLAVWEKAPGEKLKVQKPNLAVQEVNTIVSVPDRGTLALLLKGDQEQIKKSNQQMGVPLDTAALLLLKPTIILQHESEQQQFPLLEPKPK
jgi:type II secretory pathway component GspD/PulD (secretin)